MDFWRIWRLINRRIYLILSLALVAALLVLVGVFIQNLRAGVAADARLTLQQAPAPPAAASGIPAEASTTLRISELVTQLRNNNDIYLEAADLLRMDEEKRKKEVLSILERNNYFAPFDTKLQEELDQLIARGELSATERDAQLARNRDSIRQTQVALLAAPRDRQGSFAPEGVQRDPVEIADLLREKVDIIPVASLLTTENQPQFDNQVQLLGHFPRDAQATLYLNMLSVAFVNYYSIGSQASGKVRIADLTRKQDEAERQRALAVTRLSSFKNRSNLHAIIGQDATGQSFVTLEAELAKLHGERDGALQAMRTLEVQLRGMKKTTVVTLPAEENPAYKSAKQEVEKWRVEVMRLAATKGENDPELKTMRAALQSATENMKRAYRSFTLSQPNPNYTTLEGALASSHARYAASEAELRPIEARYKQLQARLRSMPKLQAEYSKIVHDLDTIEKSLAVIDQALQKEKLDNIQSGRAGTVMITRAHVLPSKNTFPNAIRLLLYATVLAVLLGVGLVVALDAVDNTVRTKKDAEQLFGLPVSGEIPAHLPDPRRAPRVAYLDPLSPTAEAYRLLRTEIQFTTVEHPFRSLLVTTCKPGQGATTTVSNLAIALAQAGKRIILVDADLRHPSLHHAFALSNEQGLTTLLSGGTVPIDAVLQRTEVENLLVLTSGPLPLNPSELLGSPQMQELHARLKSVSDVVLFDAPSAIAFSDTAVLSSFIDATLLVIRAGDIPRGVIEQVKERLVRSRANLIGVVLNAAPSEMVDSVHYHNQYYPRLKETRVSEPRASAAPVAELDEEDEPIASVVATAPTEAPASPPPPPPPPPSTPPASPEPPTAPQPQLTTIARGGDEISFEFDQDDEEDDLDLDDGLDLDEDDDFFDEDYDEAPRRTRPTPRRTGGILSWFQRR